MSHSRNHNLLLHRAFQYLGIILIVAAMGGGYWYWKQVQAGVNLQADQEGTLSNGLVGYWPFDGNDISGTTAYDRSGQGNNGALTNSPTKIIGKSGQALSFNGSNQSVAIGLNKINAEVSGASSVTLSAWVNPIIMASQMRVINFHNGDLTAGVLGFQSGAIWAGGRSQASDAFQATTVTGPATGKWSHVLCVLDYTNDIILIYLDGVLVKSTVASFGSNTFVYSANVADYIDSVGSYDAVTDVDYYNGVADEPRVYNRALSSSEIWDLYQMGNPDKVNSANSQGDSLEKGMVGYWKLDDASGTSAADSSGNGNTGTLMNGPTWTTGQIGGATDFDGTDDYIDVGNSNILNLTNNFSISSWVKINNTTQSDFKRFFGRYQLDDNNRPAYIEYDYTTNKYRSVWRNAGTYASVAGSALTSTQWQHFVVTFKDGSLKSYSDGTLIQSSVGQVQPPSSSSNTFIGTGGISGPSNHFPGSIDEVRVYNRVLSADEVAKLYRTTAPDDPDTGLVGYWPFDGKDISGTTAYDRSGNANNGTLTNSPTKAIGRVGQALGFDGTDDYVKRNVADFRSSDTVGTFSAWVRGNGRIFSSTDESVDFYYLVITSSSGKLIIEKSDNDSWHKVSTTNSPLSSDDWHHVIVFSNGSSWGMYVDGVAQVLIVEQQDNDGDWFGDVANRDNFQIGSLIRSSGYEGGFNGSIDEVRIYNRVLSANEIWSLYQMGNPDKVNSADSQGDSLEKGMVGYWKLDDASGTSASDASGNSNTGTLTNGPTWTTGQIGGATDFDGTDDYVNVGSGSSLDNLSVYSVSAWINPNVMDGVSRRIASKDYGWNFYVGDMCSKTDVIAFKHTRSTTYGEWSLPVSNTIELSAWQHVTVTYDGTSVSNDPIFYVNGNSIVANECSTPVGSLGDDSGYSGFIGGLSYSNPYFSGAIDEVRIYNRILSAEEVAKLYKTTAPDDPDTGLVGYWPFNGKDISGTTAYDRSGKGNNGTLTNGPTKTIGKIGQGLSFDGTDDYVSASGSQSVKTLSYWVKANSNANGGIELNANQYTYDNAIPAGWTSPTIYVDGVVRTPSYGSDIVTNGDFAANVTGWTTNFTMPTAWQNAVSGDGSTGYLRATVNSNVNFDRFQGNGTIVASTSYRVSFWYRTSGVTGNMRMGLTSNFTTLANSYYGPYIVPSSSWRFVSFTMTSTSASYPYFFFHKNGSIGAGSFDLDAVAITPITTHYLITDTNWHHVVITTDTAVTASAVKLGKGGLQYLSGSLDEVRMYDRALGAAEVTALYNAGR